MKNFWWLVVLAAACDGGEMPAPDAGTDDAGSDAGSASCEGRADGDACGDGRICVDLACVEESCGDGFVTAGEACDDGNAIAFDGCEGDCSYTCAADGECLDDDPCNGAESCGSDHVCAVGTPLADDTACASVGVTGTCRGGRCTALGCGNGFVDAPEECDDGNDTNGDGCDAGCTWSCTELTVCETDMNVCNGISTCLLPDHVCVRGSSLACDDGNACTADSCDRANGCRNRLIDVDGDGFAPDSLGACGTDCDDSRMDVYPGATELCDTIDQDCDGEPAPAVDPTWYVDCDGDSYAAAGATSVMQCAPPAPSGCGGGWTARVPTAGEIDCDDTRNEVRPRQPEIPGDPLDLDEDCSGTSTCFADADNDGARTNVEVVAADRDCADAGEARAAEPAGDCNDSDPTVNPGASEIPGDVRDSDENCNGSLSCYADADADGYRTNVVITSTDLDCLDAGEARTSIPGADCDDSMRTINPGAAEACNGADDDCDGRIDEGAGAYYADADGDGFGGGTAMTFCSDPGAGWTTTGGDCDDTCARCRPGYPAELCGDGRDNNCSGGVDEASCPCTFYDVATGDYLFCTNVLTWTAARDRCVQLDGRLVSFETDAERAAVWAIPAINGYTASTGHIWLGGSDSATEGTWVWTTGATFATCTLVAGAWMCSCPTGYCGFEASQPNAGNMTNSDDCTSVNPSWNGQFGDYPCSNALAYICEL